MKRMFMSLLALVGLWSVAASAQDRPSGLFTVKQLDLAGGYTAIYANAPPPGGCSCFWMNGGSAEVSIADRQRVGLVGNFGMTTASNIGDNSGHDITLATYLVGPRFAAKEWHRGSPYLQALVGAAHSSTNNTLDNGKTSFALSVGGGADVRINARFSWRVVEADYLLTRIPNGTDNEQNQLRISSGIVFHLKK